MALIELKSALPRSVIYDLRYATDNNITNRVLYTGENTVPKLEEKAAQSLAFAANLLTKKSFRLVIWDAYRPIAVQKQLLSVNSDPKYVLDPEQSNHPKGLAVDVSLANIHGYPMNLGTDFDAFGSRAHAFPDNLHSVVRYHRDVLNDAMGQHDFEVWPYEWWHFDYKGTP